jgi:hypothetical protein
MAYSHRYHTATLLANGNVLIAGGTVGPTGIADAKYTEIYSPLAGTFSAGPPMPEERQGHTATVLSNGDVLFVGNSIGDGTLVRRLIHTPAVPYTSGTYAWATALTGLPASMTSARYNHSATLLATGKLLVTGGFGADPTSAELYDPSGRTWSSAGNMLSSRAYHTSTTLRNGDVVVIGGYNGTSSLNTLDYFDALNTQWLAGQKLLNMPRAMNTSLMLSNGKVLTLGSYCPLPSGVCTTYTSSEIWAP